MEALARTVRAIDRLNDVIGRGAAWLTLAMVLTTFFVALMRYGFNWGQVWVQELYVWMHGVVFMIGAGYTLLHNGHVRVDVFYRPAGQRFKAWVDLFGTLLLLLPIVVMVFVYAWPYVAESWARGEASRETGGLPGLYLLKSVILAFCVLVGLQGLSLMGRSLLILQGHPEFALEEERPGEGI